MYYTITVPMLLVYSFYMTRSCGISITNSKEVLETLMCMGVGREFPFKPRLCEVAPRVPGQGLGVES